MAPPRRVFEDEVPPEKMPPMKPSSASPPRTRTRLVKLDPALKPCASEKRGHARPPKDIAASVEKPKRKRKRTPRPPPPPRTQIITGRDVFMIRAARLGWSVEALASLFGVSQSAVQRWEAREGQPILADRHFYDLLVVLQTVLDTDDNAKICLDSVRDQGMCRGLHMLLSLKFGNAWIEHELLKQNVSEVHMLTTPTQKPAERRQ